MTASDVNQAAVATRAAASGSPVPSRRDVLVGAGVSAVFALLPGNAPAQSLTPSTIIQSAAGEGTRFDPGALADAARVIARRQFQAPAADLPAPFASLGYEQYIGIRAQPSAVLWQGENRGFSIEPLHRGFAFANPVSLFVVEDGAVRRIAYDRSKFDFGRLTPPASIGDIGFSGFRVFVGSGDRAKETAIFQGATFFRALANGQNLGVMARTLTLKAAEPKGEEYPFFRAFWIERPIAGMGQLVIHGLFDSESATGIVRFTLRPGDMTIIDVEAQLFPRVVLDHVGFGGMTSTYLFGPQSRRNAGDIRPAAFDSTGVQMLTGAGEWVWRPLTNPESLQISVFGDQNPKGFGLLQRVRDYGAFQDDDQRFELRPSLWIEPLGEWGQGAVQLIEIPNDSDVNDNIIAYWRPRQPIQPGSDYAFALRQYWCWDPPERPPLAIVAATRTGQGQNGRRRFLVDFSGDALGETGVEFRPQLSARPGAVANLRLIPYPDRKVLRVSFELDPGSETISELRMLLERDGKPASETWLYRWTP